MPETKTTTTKVHVKIAEVMKKVGVVSKDRRNRIQNYNFRGIDDMYNALNKHLAEAGLFFTSDILSKEREERTTKSGSALIYTILLIKWTIHCAEDGSSLTSTTMGEGMDSSDKSGNKAMSSSYKYALMQLFCIPTKDPKDSENESYEVKPKTKVQYGAIKEDTSKGNSDLCAKCGAPMRVSKAGKLYCSKLCWKNKQEEPPTINYDAPPFK